ncbi:hypothetical protein MFIFM68171_10506 [Madurella fahalii]|uniref:Calcineurin-like phosphoesterase domain-containing protein n=1 Tax=Madurella fahalii TaxID=1157608 RepID=A0ABQ0GRD5_9PEZI
MPLFGKQPSGLDPLLHRPRPGAWQQFLDRPCIFLARMLYTRQPVIPAQPLADPVSVVCISDTHNFQLALPDGDILVHAGDLTQSGSLKELQAMVDWLRLQPHSIKIVIAGNHDTLLDSSYVTAGKASSESKRDLDWGDLIYLENSGTTITCPNGRRLRVYGSLRSPRHGNWAFQYFRSDDEFLKSLVRPAREAKCLLVNPSIVGGLRDDERRRPIRVVI